MLWLHATLCYIYNDVQPWSRKHWLWRQHWTLQTMMIPQTIWLADDSEVYPNKTILDLHWLWHHFCTWSMLITVILQVKIFHKYCLFCKLMILKQFIETVPYKGQCDNLKLSYNGMRVLAIHDQVAYSFTPHTFSIIIDNRSNRYGVYLEVYPVLRIFQMVEIFSSFFDLRIQES